MRGAASASTALTVIADVLALPGQEDRLRTALEALIEPSLEEPGCLGFRAYVDPNDAARMVVVEKWTNRAALEAHFTSPHLRHAQQVFDLVLSEPAQLRLLSEV